MNILYRAGGNPPIAAGLFVDENPEHDTRANQAWRLKRVAWWPAGIAPTEERVRNIGNLIDAARTLGNASVLSRDDVRRELIDGGLWAERP